MVQTKMIKIIMIIIIKNIDEIYITKKLIKKWIRKRKLIKNIK